MSYHEYYKWSLNETAEGKRANSMTNETEMPDQTWVADGYGNVTIDLSYAQAARIAKHEVRLRELEAERDQAREQYRLTAMDKTNLVAKVAGLEGERDIAWGAWEAGNSEWKRRAEQLAAQLEAAEEKLAKAVAYIEMQVGVAVYTSADAFAKQHESEASRQARATLEAIASPSNVELKEQTGE